VTLKIKILDNGAISAQAQLHEKIKIKKVKKFLQHFKIFVHFKNHL